MYDVHTLCLRTEQNCFGLAGIQHVSISALCLKRVSAGSSPTSAPCYRRSVGVRPSVSSCFTESAASDLVFRIRRQWLAVR